MDLTDITILAERHAADRDVLSRAVTDLHAAIDAAKQEALPAIRAAVRNAADSRDRLVAAIDAERHLFNSPRTRVFAGIKLGLQKGKDVIEIDDEAACIARIRAEYPADQAELLIQATEKVVKPAIKDLTTEDLKRIGVRQVPGKDLIIVKPTDSEVDKLVNALLGDELQELDEEAAA